MIRRHMLSRRTHGANYARHQRYRRLARAGRLALAGTVAAVLGLFAVRTGAAFAGAVLVVAGIVLGVRARHWLSLAERSGVRARSENVVRRALAPLQERGWRLRHGLR
ncbi:MAG: hypothetical protein JOZ95_25720 [Solirubrobacterales bacterium]|nr:hypothetical protein [Solirubrobacterales bacterium]